jgi:phosphoserine aminotransferase
MIQETHKQQLTISGISGSTSFDAIEVKQMYDHLVALYHRSKINGLVDIDSYDRQKLKQLLKLPDNYR